MMRLLTCVVLLSVSAACGLLDPKKDTSRFAVLATVDELSAQPPPERAPSARSVGLGPVALPEYVRRSEIVTRVGGTRIVPSDTERWSEPVDRAVERVLALDLARLSGLGRVSHWPWYSTDRPDVQVEITFSRFERDDKGNVVVVARWILRATGADRPTVEKEFHAERAAGGTDGASTALALSQALAELAGQIADEWVTGGRANPGP